MSRLKDLAAREKELSGRDKELAAREKALVTREKALTAQVRWWPSGCAAGSGFSLSSDRMMLILMILHVSRPIRLKGQCYYNSAIPDAWPMQH